MFAGSNILIVDDDTSLCNMIEFSFAKEGSNVFTASDGREGLQQFFEHRPDLIILDINMPKMDDGKYVSGIRDFSDVPIIMLTTMSAENYLVKGLKGGADDYIAKPFSKAELLARSEAALRRAPNRDLSKATPIYRDEYLFVNI